MEFYTGYYAKSNKYKEAGYATVQISISKPENVKVDYIVSHLAPSQALLMDYKAGKVSEEKYTEIYNGKLRAIKSDILEILKELTEECEKKQYRGIVFCCYEKAGSFCHRNLFAKYCREELGINIEELVI